MNYYSAYAQAYFHEVDSSTVSDHRMLKLWYPTSSAEHHILTVFPARFQSTDGLPSYRSFFIRPTSREQRPARMLRPGSE
jgi:hypothetical protein